MRLAEFLRAEPEAILAEWEAFARSCAPSGDTMDVAALRDHAALMLEAFAADLDAPQTPAEQAAKALGQGAAAPPGAPASATPDQRVGAGAGETVRDAVERASRHTAAGEHGAGRAESGFTVARMTAEYRALRASVVRLWTAAQGRALDARDVDDLTRFHEAIDQALAESLVRFDARVEQAKETFLAILGHDLRNPLGAIQASAAFLQQPDVAPADQRALAARIAASAERSMRMVGELLDFTRSRLGGGIPVVKAETDLVALVRQAVAEVRANHPVGQPAPAIVLRAPGGDEPLPDPQAEPLLVPVDAARLWQALTNLLVNAVQHGAPGGTVTVTIGGAAPATPVDATDGGSTEVVGGVADDAEPGVTIAVHNGGAHIAPAQLDGLFNPLQSRTVRPVRADRGPTSSLGLGLYIAERIVHAHGGQLAVASEVGAGTTFTVTLPPR